MEPQWWETALATAETSGKLSGLAIEHYTSGGLPPPHYRSDQFRLLPRAGGDVLEFATPNYAAKQADDKTYKLNVYTLPAAADDVKLIARLVRTSGAFSSAPTDVTGQYPRDALRVEIVLTMNGKQTKRSFANGAPEMDALSAAVETLIARVKSRGKHEVKP